MSKGISQNVKLDLVRTQADKIEELQAKLRQRDIDATYWEKLWIKADHQLVDNRKREKETEAKLEDWEQIATNAMGCEGRMKAKLEAAHRVLKEVVDSEYCVDGYRNVSISESAMRNAQEACTGWTDWKSEFKEYIK